MLGRLHRLTPVVLDMAARLPPGERHLLLADWDRHLHARQKLIATLRHGRWHKQSSRDQ
jgi:hypothetical protein